MNHVTTLLFNLTKFIIMKSLLRLFSVGSLTIISVFSNAETKQSWLLNHPHEFHKSVDFRSDDMNLTFYKIVVEDLLSRVDAYTDGRCV